ncbi:hypothetical protein CSUB01_05653 [Colletotrichum sublineola]|uniref:Uncharacterized protein n=1 Tax=Colletotrichum sublineola TaxID=1173701 RepID=A0A066XLE4_COLSU|nr:hypothetical protein CSUB01_05653 [Colletotrichum sublineola]
MGWKVKVAAGWRKEGSGTGGVKSSSGASAKEPLNKVELNRKPDDGSSATRKRFQCRAGEAREVECPGPPSKGSKTV